MRRHLQQDSCLEPYSLFPTPPFSHHGLTAQTSNPKVSQSQSCKFGEMLQTHAPVQ